MFIINKIQKWMDTMAGQTFMQYAYSWGAAVVILGTLFKLTHWNGADLMLCLGMGTEVFVFILSGFERVTTKASDDATEEQHQTTAASNVITNTTPVVMPMPASNTANMDPDALAHGAALSAAAANLASAGQAAAEAQLVLSQLKGNAANATTADPATIRATDPVAIEEAVSNYANELKELTEVLSRVKEQSARMSTDSEEMENLNRTLTGIATVYELQLRHISKQVGTIEKIDEQTRQMADHIAELNSVYARMIQALTVNMGGVQGGFPNVNKD